MRSAIALGVIIVAGALAYVLWPTAEPSVQSSSDSQPANVALVEVLLPDALSQNAQAGKLAYETSCAVCHGANAAGQIDVAPPLVHIIYEPNHHGDESFQRAAALGVRAHHWSFGNMPPVEGVTRDEVNTIVTYIRELQRANGIN